MNYKILYSRNKKNFSNPVSSTHYYNMGDWRSRWDRKRDLDKQKGVYIKRG